LIPALEKLYRALEAKAKEFWDIIKIGRTHLMDASRSGLARSFPVTRSNCVFARARSKSIEVLRELRLVGQQSDGSKPAHRSAEENIAASGTADRHRFLRGEKSF